MFDHRGSGRSTPAGELAHDDTEAELEIVPMADTSVMPAIPSGNLDAPATMIGERAADFIRRGLP
jgi:choline dehydrogenase-like flavoprotein